MFHTRTKKVASYGRRAQRVVAVSDDRRFSFDVSSETTDAQSDIDARPPLGRDGDTDNNVYALPTGPVWTKSLKTRPKAASRSDIAPERQRAASKKFNTKRDTSRQPLRSYTSNIPNTPIVPPKFLKSAGKRTPLHHRNVSNISPYVDVDIVVLDDSGRRLSKEKRVTKSNVQMNDVDGKVIASSRRARRATALKSYTAFVSDGEDDEDDNDDDYVPRCKAASDKCARADPSRGSKNHVRRKKASRASGTRPVSGTSVPERLQESKTTRRAGRTVVVSDSESESSPSEGIPAKHSRDGCDDKNGHLTKVQSRNAKADQVPVDHDQSKYAQTGRGVDPSRSPVSQRQPKKHVAPKPHLLKSRSKAVGRDNISRRMLASQDVTVQGNISAGSDSSLNRLHQLTPVKPANAKSTFLQQRPIKSSPSQVIVLSDDDSSLSIDDELELALRVADIEIAKSSQVSTSPTTNGSILSHSTRTTKPKQVHPFLRPLLSECGQLAPLDFEAFIDTFPSDPIIGFLGQMSWSEKVNNGRLASNAFQKVGEASYSEVFGIGNVVLKVIPLLDEQNHVSATWTASWDSPPVSEAKDVLKEVVVTKAMGETCKGFIRLLRAHVVQGAYPQSLLSLWDHYDNVKGSESVRPDHFTSLQTYAIIILPNGGPDLENFTFDSASDSSWRQACSVFWQVAQSLGRAEELVQFEHRDLHWGQILVRNTRKTSMLPQASRLSRLMPLDDPSHGVQATIIDLGLARIDRGHGDSYWTPFTEEIFEGKGDYQYDVYRMMRGHNLDEWHTFKPLTNVMWLHYLTERLINHKRIPHPVYGSVVRGRKSRLVDTHSAAVDADKRAYECLLEVERALRSSIAHVARSIGVKIPERRQTMKNGYSSDKINEDKIQIGSAVDILRLGKERKWIL